MATDTKLKKSKRLKKPNTKTFIFEYCRLDRTGLASPSSQNDQGVAEMQTKMGNFRVALAWMAMAVAVCEFSLKADAFTLPNLSTKTQRSGQHESAGKLNHQPCASTSSRTILYSKPEVSAEIEPQVMSTGYSQQMDLNDAIKEAMEMALQSLPNARNNKNAKIDLAIVSISSLYDGNSSPSTVVPTCLDIASSYGRGIQHLVGSSVGGIVSSVINTDDSYQEDTEDEEDEDEEEKSALLRRACTPTELEGVPGVSVMLAILPDVNLKVRGIPLICGCQWIPASSSR